jgi:hypothetical protein
MTAIPAQTAGVPDRQISGFFPPADEKNSITREIFGCGKVVLARQRVRWFENAQANGCDAFAGNASCGSGSAKLLATGLDPASAWNNAEAGSAGVC